MCQACRIKSRHLREGNLVGAELFAFGAVFWWHGPAGVNVEAGMFQGLHAGNQFWGDEFVAEQFLENSIVKEFGQNAMRDLRCEMEGAVGIEQTVGDERLNVGMKIEVFISAVIASDPGEATFQGAAVEEFPEDIAHNGTKGAVFVFVGVGIYGYERVMVAMNALPQGRFSRISSLVGPHMRHQVAGERTVSRSGFQTDGGFTISGNFSSPVGSCH